MLSMGTSMVWQAGITSMPQRCISLASLLSSMPAISPLSTSDGVFFFDAIYITTFPAPHVDGGEPLLLPPLLSASHAYALSLSPPIPLVCGTDRPSFQAVLMVACARPYRATRPSDRLFHERAGKARSQNRQAGWYDGHQKDERELNNTAGKKR